MLVQVQYNIVLYLYEHNFLTISVLGLGNLKVLFPSEIITAYVFFQKENSEDMVKDDNKPDVLKIIIVSHT